MVAPTVNITNSPGLTLIDDAETTTGWAGFNDGSGGTPSVIASTEIFVQNTASNSVKISGTAQNKGLWFDNTTGIDMTTTGRHLYMWVQMTTPVNLFAIASGGLYIKIASDASGNNWNKYYVAGIDTSPVGFVRYVIDLNKTPSETAATAATLTSIRWFGAGVNQTGSAKAENVFIDRMDYGDGLQIEDGDSTTPASWQELFDGDDAIANKYGIIEKRGSIFYLKGGLAIGDASSTATTLWEELSGAIVEFENPLYYNGTALVSAIDAANLYKIDLVGNATGTTDIDWGSVVGTGDDRQGVGGGAILSAGPPFAIDGETDIADLDTVNFYGTIFRGAGIINLSGSTKTDVIGCVFTNCDEVQPNDAEFLNNTISAPRPDRGLEMLSTHTMKKLTFIAGRTADIAADRVLQVDASGPTYVDETDDFNSATTGDVLPFPATEAIGDYCAFGSRHKFGKLRVDTGTARSGGTLIWEYWNGSSWATLAGLSDGTNTLSTTGLQDLTFTAPTDWAALSIDDETPLLYLRIRVTATMTTNPVLDQGFIADTIEHHVHFPLTIQTGVTFDEMLFFGHGAAGAPKWHGEDSETRNTITAGSFVVSSSYQILVVGSTDFTLIGAASNTIGVMFTATGVGSGTGTAFEITEINATNGADPDEDDFEPTGATPADVNVTQSVTVTFEAVDKNDAAIASVLVTAYLISNDSEVINVSTNGSGIATTTFAGSTPADLYYRYRKSSTGATKYRFLSGFGEILGGTGLTVKRSMQVDEIADPSI